MSTAYAHSMDDGKADRQSSTNVDKQESNHQDDLNLTSGKDDSKVHFYGYRLNKSQLYCYGLIALVILAVIIIGVIVVVITVNSSRKTTAAKPEASLWYEKSVGYQIFPRSFQDSNGDGVGDLAGIVSRLGYLKWLTIDAIWLSALNPSPYGDTGLDISDFIAVDPILGSLEDFQNLVEAAHNKGIRVVIEFVPNQSSKEHTWFEQSKQNKNNPYSDYYVWADGTSEGAPPNDWTDASGNSSWEYSPTRNQWYHYSYKSSAPSLNYDNPRVETAMTDALRFWVGQGIDGVYVRHVNHIFGISDVMDHKNESPNISNKTRVHSLIKNWREILKGTEESEENVKLLTVDSMDLGTLNTNIDFTTSMYGTEEEPLADYPFNYALFDIHKHHITGHTIRYLVESWLEEYRPYDAPTNWAVGSSQISRLATRYEPRFVPAVIFLTIALPGSPLLYYGDEIGMTDVWNDDSQTAVPYAPMQWSADANASFTENGADAWTPIADNTTLNNVEIQLGNTSSLLHLVRRAILLRHDAPWLLSPRQSVRLYGMHSMKELLIFVRHEKNPVYRIDLPEYLNFLFVANFGDLDVTEDLTLLVSSIKLPDIGGLVFSSFDVSLHDTLIDLKHLTVRSGEAMIIIF